jgi:hypothetical protein
VTTADQLVVTTARMLAYRRHAVGLVVAIAMLTIAGFFTQRIWVGLLTLVLVVWFAYVVVFAMRLRIELRAPPGDVAGRLLRAVDGAIATRSRPSRRGDRLVVRPSNLYAVRFRWRERDGGTLVTVEADTPARAFLERKIVLDRSASWERLVRALFEQGFEVDRGP